MRYADVDADGTTGNNFDATLNSAFGWNSQFSNGNPAGLVLQNLGSPSFFHSGFVQSSFHGPDPCNPNAALVFGLETATDGCYVLPGGLSERQIENRVHGIQGQVEDKTHPAPRGAGILLQRET